MEKTKAEKVKKVKNYHNTFHTVKIILAVHIGIFAFYMIDKIKSDYLQVFLYIFTAIIVFAFSLKQIHKLI